MTRLQFVTYLALFALGWILRDITSPHRKDRNRRARLLWRTCLEEIDTYAFNAQKWGLDISAIIVFEDKMRSINPVSLSYRGGKMEGFRQDWEDLHAEMVKQALQTSQPERTRGKLERRADRFRKAFKAFKSLI